MRHSQIAAAAVRAALDAADLGKTSPAELPHLGELYDYARERKFPPAETLARKHADLLGERFPAVNLAAAPEQLQVLYTTFRAVAEALEPFHQDDDPNAPEPQPWPATGTDQTEPTMPPIVLDLVSRAGVKTPDELVIMAIAGANLMASIEAVTKAEGPFKDWKPLFDPSAIVTDLFDVMNEQRQARLAAEDARREAETLLAEAQEELMSDKPKDDVESRTKAAQMAMDEEAAKHQFDPPETDPPAADQPKGKKSRK